MQIPSAYIDQIPPGVARPRPPPSAPAPAAAPQPRPLAPGLYVQVASLVSPADALAFGVQLASRLGSERPAAIRGVAVEVNGQRRIRMLAGPFATRPAALRFCGLALESGEPCLIRQLGAPPSAPPLAPGAVRW